jgi:hypothetical protein
MTAMTLSGPWVGSGDRPAWISAFLSIWKRRKRRRPEREPMVEDQTLIPGF